MKKLIRTKNELIKITTQLFNKIQACWGNKWTSNFDANQELFFTALNEWQSGIADLTDNEIETAFHITKYTSAFPPSISEFRILALGILPPQEALNICHDIYFKQTNNEKEPMRGVPEIIIKIYNRIGSYSFGHMQQYELRRMFFSMYDFEITKELMPRERIVL